MARIPIVTRLTQLAHDPGQQLRGVNGTPRRAGASMALGASMAGLSRVLEDLADQRADERIYDKGMEDSRKLMEADLDTMKAQESIAQFMAENPDPDTWEGFAQGQIEGLAKRHSAAGLGDAYAQKLEGNLSQFAIRTLGRVGEQAARERTQRFKSSALATAELAAEQGDFERLDASLYSLQSKTGISDDEVGVLRGKFVDKYVEGQVYKRMIEDPVSLYADLGEKTESGEFANYPDMHEHRRYTALRSTKLEVGRYQSGNYNALMDELAAKQYRDDEDLAARQERGEITAGQKVSYQRMRDKWHPKIEHVAEVAEALDNFKMSTDGDYTELNTLEALIRPLPPIYSKPMMRRLEREAATVLDPKASSEADRSTKSLSTIMGMVGEDYRRNMFGYSRKIEGDKFAADAAEPTAAERKEATERYLEVREKLEHWFDSQEDEPTETEVFEEYHRITKPYRQEQKLKLSRRIPGPFDLEAGIVE